MIMDDDFFTKRFVECVKKPHEERDGQVHMHTLHVYPTVLLPSCSSFSV